MKAGDSAGEVRCTGTPSASSASTMGLASWQLGHQGSDAKTRWRPRSPRSTLEVTASSLPASG